MSSEFTSFQRFVAWTVHLYTGLGLLCAAGIVLLVFRGDPSSMHAAFLLMALATAIDATDGFFARRARVKEVLPGFDGRRLDDLIDFQTYTCLPLLLIWRAHLLPPGQEGWLALPLLASAYGFCQVEAKTEDGYFLGFPSYWNIVAFYLYMLRFPPLLALGIVIFLAVLTFVPLRYIYPTVSGGTLNLITNVGGAAWGILLVIILLDLPSDPRPWLMVSAIYPAFYMLASWTISLRISLRRQQHAAG